MKYICKRADALYKSKEWIVSKHINDKKTITEMCSLAGCTYNTLHNWMVKFGIKTLTKERPRIKRGCYAVGKEVPDCRGYIQVHLPSHPRSKSNGLIYKHRLVAEEMLGRPLERSEVVHHINRDRSDNRPENLMVFPTVGKHLSYHRRERKK